MRNQYGDLISALATDQELVLQVLQPPLAFHRILVDASGSVLAGLLLSALIELSDLVSEREAWFDATDTQLTAMTGLNGDELRCALSRLLQLKFIDLRHLKYPERTQYRVNFENLCDGITNHTERQRAIDYKPTQPLRGWIKATH